MAVTDWGGANSRFLGLVSVGAARSFDQTALRPSVIKRIRQIDVKYITHITSLGVTAWTRMCEPPTLIVHWTYWILDFKQLLLLLLSAMEGWVKSCMNLIFNKVNYNPVTFSCNSSLSATLLKFRPHKNLRWRCSASIIR